MNTVNEQLDAMRIMELLSQGFVINRADPNGKSFRDRYNVWQNLGSEGLSPRSVIIDENGIVMGMQG